MADIDPQELSAAELKELVSSHSDDEIRAKLDEMDPQVVLDRVFSEMQERFRPEKAGSTNAGVQFQIDDLAYFIKIADGSCTTGRGKVEDERVGLRTSLPTFLKLITGVTEGMSAFMTGKLKVRGDMMFAPQMLGYFDRP